MTGDWPIHALWFAFGALTAYVSVFALAPVVLSSRISQAQRAENTQERAAREEAPDA